jgi:phytoene dehydrogenase-like protein
LADVVVAGSGLGGLAAAARLAKLGHTVTVLERSAVPGGAMRRLQQDGGFGWDAGPSSTTLPAVLRDLFRKSGRPLERYVDLVLRTPARRHVFEDGSVVDLPTGSRGDQIAAIDAGLGHRTGAAWAAFVDGLGPVWDDLRRSVLDVPDGGDRLSDPTLARTLSARTSLEKRLRRSLKDERLRAMADFQVRLAGSQPKDAPAVVAVESYVERSFGTWGVPGGGMAAVTEALLTRLGERGVTLELSCDVTRLVVSQGRVTGVELVDASRRPADVVVTDVDPRTVLGSWLPRDLDLPGRRVFGSATPAIPVGVTHLGLSPGTPDLPDEVVLHGEPLLVVTTTGSAPPGDRAWTVWRRGSAQEDVLVTMVRRGLDVRAHLVTRLDRTPIDLIQETSGSSYGLAWAGWRAHVQRSAQTHPLPGLYLVGASMHPGASIPYVAWGAAHVATRIGKAH